MSKSILFLIALVALPVALIAFVLSGRRPRGEEHQSPAPAPVAASAPAIPATPAPPAAEVAARLHELAFGAPLRPPADEPAHREVAAAVDLLLSGPVLKPEYAPRRPLHLPKLVQAVNDENVSRRELAVLIAQDPALAGNLLRLANSAFYRVNSQPVESIDRAVTLLGTSGIRSLMAAALLQPVPEPRPGSSSALRTSPGSTLNMRRAPPRPTRRSSRMRIRSQRSSWCCSTVSASSWCSAPRWTSTPGMECRPMRPPWRR